MAVWAFGKRKGGGSVGTLVSTMSRPGVEELSENKGGEERVESSESSEMTSEDRS